MSLEMGLKSLKTTHHLSSLSLLLAWERDVTLSAPQRLLLPPCCLHAATLALRDERYSPEPYPKINASMSVPGHGVLSPPYNV